MKILVLESSTTSAKAMLYDTDSASWNIASKAYGFVQDSQALHDPDAVFALTAAAAKELAGSTQADIILLSTTWHSVMLCSRNGTPLSPVELWCYTGASELCSTLRSRPGYADEYYRRTGSLVNSTYPYFKLMEKRNAHSLPSDCRIGGQGTYNMYKLTGEWVTTLSMASGSGLVNIQAQTYDDDLLASIGISRERIPAIVPYGTTYPLSKEGAELLAQKEGTPVVPAFPDGALNQVGAGALAHGIMTFSVGTSAAVRMTTKEAVLPGTPSLWSYFAPGAHLLGAATSGACNCQDWFKKTFFPSSVPYSEIENRLTAARSTPVFLPFLFGERCPGWQENRSGGFELLKPEHTPYDMYQSVLEGILFNVYQCYNIIEATAGRPRIIKLSGGILHSAVWTQMCADIFGREMTVDKTDQGSVMGCAVIGMHLLGTLKSLESFSPEPDRTVVPDMKMHDIYMEKYRRYCTCYDAQPV